MASMPIQPLEEEFIYPEQERQRAEQETQQERQNMESLIARLRAKGIELD
ncbi:MAG: hypothetical protein WCS37_18910 [Chloroflexota bacterium]